IGKLIPAGTGSKFERETTELIKARAAELDEIREAKLLAAQEESSLPSELIGRDDEEDAAEEVPSDTEETIAEE
ncbi:MAG: hypothetical protein II529_00835, partial [Erysipelotrichaceae bacterium]|nr:hypothetical protein [Erysipelotrichaceae bacterium]